MAVLIKLGDNLVPVNSLIIGGKEPNLQEKTVNITSNGTSEVLPDGEYTGLSKVNINANVPNKFKSLVVGDIVNVTAEDLQGINNISSYCFYQRNILNSVEIPSNITNIGINAFQYCRALKNLILHEGIQYINNNAFGYCDELIEIIIPNTVTTIGQSAFSYCQKLTSITIPDSVTSLGNYAFSSCPNLTTVNLGNGLTSIPQGAFQSNKKLVNLSEIPNSVTSIGNSAFSNCSGLTSITIGNNVTSIGNYAFQNCSGLTSITIPANVKTVGGYAFQRCSGLTSLTIEEGVEKLGESVYVNYTFQGCTNISGEVIIPSTINYIANGTFDGCKKIEKYTYKAQVTSIPNSCFYFSTSCKTFKCETAITAIQANAFYTCNAMELYDFRNCTVVPTLADTSLGHKDGCQIVVPDALYDEWIAATNWSSLTNVVFVKASEYVEV